MRKSRARGERKGGMLFDPGVVGGVYHMLYYRRVGGGPRRSVPDPRIGYTRQCYSSMPRRAPSRAHTKGGKTRLKVSYHVSEMRGTVYVRCLGRGWERKERCRRGSIWRNGICGRVSQASCASSVEQFLALSQD